jgi:hypothetical protein
MIAKMYHLDPLLLTKSIFLVAQILLLPYRYQIPWDTVSANESMLKVTISDKLPHCHCPVIILPGFPLLLVMQLNFQIDMRSIIE